jgi:hypothetical protein
MKTKTKILLIILGIILLYLVIVFYIASISEPSVTISCQSPNILNFSDILNITK